MAKRVKIEEEVADDETKSSYFTSTKENLEFVSTGCTLLDCALGGGYVLGRMVNPVGDKSTAKTGLATEALINFKKAFPAGKAAYRETEGAYDIDYAEAMGAPIDEIDFGNQDDPIVTVEAFEKDFKAFIASCQKEGVPGIYVLDSFDSLSDEAEMKSDISDGSYGMAKQKKIGIMFRKLNKQIEKSRVLLIIVSQVRENINAMFGEKYRRSGGKALDFYATHIFWLAHLKTLKRTIKKVERAYGISLQAKVKKNKVGFPFREAKFDFIFGFGVDDLGASVNWLKEVGRLKDIGVAEANYKKYLAEVDTYEAKAYNKERRRVSKVVKIVWNEIETNFLPKRKKY
jgi:recombination protein RecA